MSAFVGPAGQNAFSCYMTCTEARQIDAQIKRLSTCSPPIFHNIIYAHTTLHRRMLQTSARQVKNCVAKPSHVLREMCQ